MRKRTDAAIKDSRSDFFITIGPHLYFLHYNTNLSLSKLFVKDAIAGTSILN